MHRGYTKRWRKRWDKGYHVDHLLWVMMGYFIDFATYKDKEFPFIWKGALVEMVKLKRGQCFFTFKGIRDFFNSPLNPVSRKMVRRRIKILEKIGFLAHEQGRHYQVVTICNYDKYNPTDRDEGYEQGHQAPINGTSNAHQSAITNKDKEYKEYKKRNKELECSNSKTFERDSIPYFLSETLLERIKINLPDFKPARNSDREKTIQRWAIDIDRMIRIDERNPCHIWNMILWTQDIETGTGEFWHKNIMSGGKLRKQYDTLSASINTDLRKLSKNKTQNEKLQEVGRRWLEKKIKQDMSDT